MSVRRGAFGKSRMGAFIKSRLGVRGWPGGFAFLSGGNSGGSSPNGFGMSKVSDSGTGFDTAWTVNGSTRILYPYQHANHVAAVLHVSSGFFRLRLWDLAGAELWTYDLPPADGSEDLWCAVQGDRVWWTYLTGSTFAVRCLSAADGSVLWSTVYGDATYDTKNSTWIDADQNFHATLNKVYEQTKIVVDKDGGLSSNLIDATHGCVYPGRHACRDSDDFIQLELEDDGVTYSLAKRSATGALLWRSTDTVNFLDAPSFVRSGIIYGLNGNVKRWNSSNGAYIDTINVFSLGFTAFKTNVGVAPGNDIYVYGANNGDGSDVWRININNPAVPVVVWKDNYAPASPSGQFVIGLSTRPDGRGFSAP